jgi:hypothetical protein
MGNVPQASGQSVIAVPIIARLASFIQAADDCSHEITVCLTLNSAAERARSTSQALDATIAAVRVVLAVLAVI